MSAVLLTAGMGEVVLGREGQQLCATLGSCVAIALLWRAGGCCALAHCLLPQASARGWRIGARHVDQALPSMFALMGVRQRDLGQLDVVLAGGANMLGAAGVASGIGAENVAAARRCLAAAGLDPLRAEVGGRRGRLLRIDCSSYEIMLSKVERNCEEFDHATI